MNYLAPDTTGISWTRQDDLYLARPERAVLNRFDHEVTIIDRHVEQVRTFAAELELDILGGQS